MHEVAHQLSWNCGLLNRGGDVPFWLAEALACYCEPTSNGSWQGIGEPNLARLRTLAAALSNKTPLIPLHEVVSRNDWMPPQRDDQTTSLAYAQSWALFQLLIREHPAALQSYFKTIYSRSTSDRRLADFQQAFGSDLLGLEQRYADSIKELVRQHARRLR